jgi:hypothetical protein
MTLDFSTYTTLLERYPNVSPADAAHILWVFDNDRKFGREPGGFTTLLIRAAGHADIINLSRLMAGFPGITQAVLAYQHEPNGLVWLRERAAGQ